MNLLIPVKCPVCGDEPTFKTYPRTGRASLGCGGKQEECGRDINVMVTHEIYIGAASPEAVFAEWLRRYPIPQTKTPAKGDTEAGEIAEVMDKRTAENSGSTGRGEHSR